MLDKTDLIWLSWHYCAFVFNCLEGSSFSWMRSFQLVESHERFCGPSHFPQCLEHSPHFLELVGQQTLHCSRLKTGWWHWSCLACWILVWQAPRYHPSLEDLERKWHLFLWVRQSSFWLACWISPSSPPLAWTSDCQSVCLASSQESAAGVFGLPIQHWAFWWCL